jgi:hypothetical protein
VIQDILKENLPQYVLNDTDGYSIYHRGNRLDVHYFNAFEDSMVCENVILIASQEDWQEAILRSGAHMHPDQTQLVSQTWINLLCHVKTAPKAPKRRNSQQTSQEQDFSQSVGFAQDPFGMNNDESQDEGQEDWEKEMNFGWNITLKLCIRGPTYSRENFSKKYILRNRKSEFTVQGTFLLSPPYTHEYL